MICIEERHPVKVSGISSFFVSFIYSEPVVNALKTLPNYYYHKKDKIWEIPACYLSLLLDTLTFIDDIALKLINVPEIQTISKTDLTPEEVEAFKYTPFKHQVEAINYGLSRTAGNGWLLLDSMGLGKSLSMMYLAETLHKRGLIDHCLIICGVASLRQNWKKECLKFSNESAVVLGEKIAKSGRIYYKSMKERVEILKNPIDEFFVITNIESLQNEAIVEAINKSGKFGMMAFDEAHRGSRSSQMGTNLMKLKAPYKVAATGTIIVNNPQSAFVPLVWTGNDASTFTNFKSLYCEFGGFNNYQVVGYKNLDLLKDELDSCSLRRTLDQVRDDMPAKTIETEIIELDESHRKFYDAIKQGVAAEADKVHLDASNLLALTTRLRQATSCPGFLDTNPPESTKIRRCIELVEDIIDTGEKVVVLATFKESVNELAAKLAKFRPLINTGDVPDDLVSRNIDEFQNNPESKLFIGTWAKCSTGITLNAASYMICLDTPYTDAMFQQGCDRIYRVTNTRPAFIKVLLCADTIDERVWQIVETKKDLGDYLVDGKENNFANESFTNELRSILADIF